MANAVLTLSSKNYSSWSLRGWLLCRMAGLDFVERRLDADDPQIRQELLLLSPSLLVPKLTHEGVTIWDVQAIAEYLAELKPAAGLLPQDRKSRAHCRAICGEMHSGFYNLRSALPMNLRTHHRSFKIFSGARPDIQRVQAIWQDCLENYGGPYLFGSLTMADAMYAPVCTRFATYAVDLEPALSAYCDRILAWPLVQEWTAAALAEPEEIVELDVEF